MLKRKTIGNRLISAISLMAFLSIGVSLIALITWENLDDQIDAIVSKNLPTLRASYHLERNTASLKDSLHKISFNKDPARHAELRQNITQSAGQITESIANTASLASYPALKLELETLLQDIEDYTDLLNKRTTLLLILAQSEARLNWLHLNIVEELVPIRQELEWQLTRLDPNQLDDEKIRSMIHEFSLLQSITIRENELHQLVKDIFMEFKNRDISNTFQYIGHRTTQLKNMGDVLSHYPSTSLFRQHLDEMIRQVEPNGPVERQLRTLSSLQKSIQTYDKKIQNRLIYQEELIQAMVDQADSSLLALNDHTRRSVIISSYILLGVVLLAITLSVLLSIYLVSRGIVTRLNQLSHDLYAVAHGDLNATIQVDGDDEIGLLGGSLRQFRQQMLEMQQSNALNLINNTQASIITCNLAGVVESVNPSALALFHADTIPKGHTVWSLFSHNTETRLKSLFQTGSLLQNNQACSLTIRHTYHHEPRYLRLDFRQFSQGHEDKVIITMTDITEQESAARWLEGMVHEKTESLTKRNRQLKAEVEDRKRIEADLRATQDELIQAAKMAVVGQTMTSLAHELNQPLSAMSTHLFATKMAVGQNNFTLLPASLDKMESLTERMGRIISSLRNFAKKQSANRAVQAIDIQQSVSHAQQLIENRMKVQQTTLLCHIDNSYQVMADPIQFEQVLVNLFVNSCDAVAGSDTREIHVDVLDSHADQQSVRLAVSDTGPGFAASIIEKLFIPFTTTKDVGLGLGLNICRSIMNRIEGDIYLASTLQGGAMVVLELKKYDDYR
ncbi:ATP-binding protein [Photobacterium galatheae]|uniref:C4-dicarboxylate transport sensor protein DctB n=1 Tax=Photobacterium galatheae TaxID=1654360 RepID=A0A066RQ26_9GAMM|nr:ATP-binding protein [Photobacterium galatheae]KDM92565.1 histidine kinase [Photobacterium galatheae]